MKAFICSVENFYTYQSFFITPNIPHEHYLLDSQDKYNLAVISIETKGIWLDPLPLPPPQQHPEYNRITFLLTMWLHQAPLIPKPRLLYSER